MKRTQAYSMILAALAMLVLILDGKTAMLGMLDGLELCLRTVIPALFPFLFFSGILTDSLYGKRIPVIGKLARWCKIPENLGCFLIIGFLGGYPTGAANAATLRRTGQLDHNTARRLAIICNNAGPAFLFGILGGLFSQMKFVWFLWLIHISSCLIVARILPGEAWDAHCTTVQRQRTIPTLLNGTIKTMASICAWVMLFRLILTFLQRWFLWMLPETVSVFFTGILELSNGCLSLYRIQSEELRFCLAAFLLGFGGFCVTLQTYSVCDGMDLRGYICAKLLHGTVSLGFAVGLLNFGISVFLTATIFMIPSFLSFPRKSEKRGSNSTAGVV